MGKLSFFVVVLLALTGCAHNKKSVEPPANTFAEIGRIGVVDAENGRIDVITQSYTTTYKTGWFHSQTVRVTGVESFHTNGDTKASLNKRPARVVELQNGMGVKVSYQLLMSPRGEYDKVAVSVTSGAEGMEVGGKTVSLVPVDASSDNGKVKW